MKIKMRDGSMKEAAFEEELAVCDDRLLER